MARRATAALASLTALSLSVAGLGPAAGADSLSLRFHSVVSNARFPTNMAFAPDGRLFYNEKDEGNIRIVEDGRLLPKPFASLDVQGGGESGLLGLALDPQFLQQPWVYVYYTSSADGRNHLARIEAHGDTGGPPQNLLTLLTASGIHNGGDLAFGPDGKLYVVVGETGNNTLAQNRNSLGGKILRLNPDGSIPPDNPFGHNKPMFSMGHRNSFGLCFNPQFGDLWETENGPESYDELNQIQAGGNYGWAAHLGPGGAPQFMPPALAFRDIIVPTGCTFYDRALPAGQPAPASGTQLLFGDFHGDLHRVVLGPSPHRTVLGQDVVAHFDAGITDVEEGPDGGLYVATSSSILKLAGAGAAGGATGSATPFPAQKSGGGSAAWVWAAAAAAAAAIGGAAWLLYRRRGRTGITPPSA